MKRSNIFPAQIGDPIFGRRGYNRTSKGGGDKLEGGLGAQPDGGLGVQPDGGLGAQPDGGLDHQVVHKITDFSFLNSRAQPPPST